MEWFVVGTQGGGIDRAESEEPQQLGPAVALEGGTGTGAGDEGMGSADFFGEKDVDLITGEFHSRLNV
jgi:hypothetical protein